MKNDRDVATFSNEAADFFLKAGQKDQAVSIYKESVEAFKKSGNFDSAGTALRKIGEYYESQSEPELAAEYFKKAADMFSLAKYHVTDATKLNLKVADIYSELTDKPEKLKEAISVGLLDIRGSRQWIYQQQPHAVSRKGIVYQIRADFPDHGGGLIRMRLALRSRWRSIVTSIQA